MLLISKLKDLFIGQLKGFGHDSKIENGQASIKTELKTQLRTQLNQLSPELTASEMAEQQSWTEEQIKNLKTWQKGDLILETYLVEEIIAGGMGCVYIAKHEDWSVKMAIKAPNEKMLSNKRFFSRVLREANSWIELGLHPHIAYCYYVRRIDGIPHIFIEYVDGGNLQDWIDNKKCYDLKIGIDLAIQFCHGMEYAHNHGMIHRDIKPHNILMTSDGILKVTDFGIARVGSARDVAEQPRINASDTIDENSHLTSIGTIMGSAQFMSPEQWADPGGVDARADIYSFGVCMYEMFCNSMPYNTSISKRTPEEEPQNPRKIRRGFPASLANVMIKCVAWEKEKRYETFRELREEFLDIYKELFNEDPPSAKIRDIGLKAQGLNNRAVSYMELSRKNDALALWDEALREEPQHLEATYNQGVVLWRDGKLTDDELVKRLEIICSSSADSWLTHYLLALLHLERGDMDSAMPLLETATQQVKSKSEMRLAHNLVRSLGSLEARRLRAFGEHNSEIHSISISSDGQYALSGSGFFNKDNVIRLWDIETGKCLKTFEGHTGIVASVAFCSDNKHIISGSYDDTVQVWDLEKEISILKLEGHTGHVTSISLSSDGRFVLSGSNDTTLRLWDLENKECCRPFEGHVGYVNSVALSHDGKFALSGSTDKTMRVWDVATGQCIKVYEGHESFVRSVCFSNNGQYALSGSDDKTVKFWDLNEGKCIHTLEGHKGFVRSVCISEANQYAISSSDDNTIRIWDLAAGRCLRTLEGHNGFVRSVCLSNDNKYAISGGDDKVLMLWELALEVPSIFPLRLSRSWSHAELVKMEKQAEELIEKANKALTNNRFAYTLALARQLRKLPGYKLAPETIELWKKLSLVCECVGIQAAWHVKTFRGHLDRITSISMDANGRTAISGSNDGNILLWDLESGECLRTLQGHTMDVRSVSITSDGLYALSGGGDETLRFWNVKTGECLNVFGENMGIFCAVHLDSDKTLGLSADIPVKGELREQDESNLLRLWDVTEGVCLKVFAGHTNWINSVYMSAEGYYALSGGYDNTVRLWEVASGRCLQIFRGHSGPVHSVCLSSNANYALSGSADGTLRLWRANTGECVQIFRGHTDSVRTVTISRDSRHAVSGGNDNTVRLWDITTGQCVYVLEGHTDWVNSVCISDDSRYILSGSEDETIRLWELDWELEPKQTKVLHTRDRQYR